MFKIVGIDNFARDTVSDYLVADNIKNKELADVMCEALNAKYCKHESASTYYVVKPNDYKLYRYEP